MKFTDRLKSAWNVFTNKDPTFSNTYGGGYFRRPDRLKLSNGNDKSIVTAVLNRISIDCSGVKIRHVILDNDGRYLKDKDSGLNSCLSYSANLDQTGRALIQDIVLSLLDEGVVAVVPTDVTTNPDNTGEYEINTLRVGKILEWFPNHVRVRLYNQNTGRQEELILPKEFIAIIESPLYAVLNEPNSTLQRLIRKLALIDYVDASNHSGKLDLLIQLPYTVRGEQRKTQAETRIKSIEDQLVNSKYGIAYADATEKVIQLNRSLENNLMSQIEYLTSMLYSQLGMTDGILNGTASPQELINYNNRTVEPVVSAIVLEFTRKYLTKTAIAQKQIVTFFNDPFKMVPIHDLAEIADKFTRNAILSSNEFRQIMGFKPSDDPYADSLINNNLYPDQQQMDFDPNQEDSDSYSQDSEYST